MRLTFLLLLCVVLVPAADEVQKPTWASGFGTDQYGTWAEFTAGPDVVRMRYIPGGQVPMRSRLKSEVQHVSIPAFWLAESECTRGLFHRVNSLSRSFWIGPTSASWTTFNYSINDLKDRISRAKRDRFLKILTRHYDETALNDSIDAVAKHFTYIKEDLEADAKLPYPEVADLEAMITKVQAKIDKEYEQLGEQAQLPAEGIAWKDVEDICRNLKKRVAGAKILLPSEAQLVWASRAGQSDEQLRARLDDIAWHAGNSAGFAHSVKSKQPNAWGLYDIFGNEWEWCAGLPRSWHEPAGIANPQPVSEPETAFGTAEKGIADGTIVAVTKTTVVVRSVVDKDGTLSEIDHQYVAKSGFITCDARESGGLDPGMLQTIRDVRVGDRVRVSWVWKGDRRLEAMKRHESKVLFGGSWAASAEESLAVPYRDGDGPGLRLFNVGFRFIISATPSPGVASTAPVQPVESAKPAR